jgi:iron complex outermembrane receptor protein
VRHTPDHKISASAEKQQEPQATRVAGKVPGERDSEAATHHIRHRPARGDVHGPARARRAGARARSGGPEHQLEALIVTAQKREENVQTTPLSITAVTGTNLAKDRVLSLEDLGHNMTGISFTANSPQSNEINIRGVVNTRLSSPTSDQSVSTFVDDVYVGRSGNLNSAFYDIQRIEVVRGPQGVLLGKNVAGGAVNIISNAPSFERSGKFTVSLGNYDLRQTQGYFTGAITDEVAARVSFQTIHHGGYARDLLHNVDIENLDSVQGRIQLPISRRTPTCAPA